MTVYQPDSQLRIDLADKTIQRHAVGQAESFPGIPEIIGESFHYDQGDALRDQIDHFLQCISQQTSPRASGQAGLDALRVAEQIAHAISQNPSIDVTDYEQQTT